MCRNWVRIFPVIAIGCGLAIFGELMSRPEGIAVAGEIELSPWDGSEVLLQEPRLQRLADGSRLLRFRVESEPLRFGSFVFLVDPLRAEYRTGIFNVESEDLPDAAKQLREKWGDVEWDRLPAIQKLWRDNVSGSRDKLPGDPSQGIIWAEARSSAGAAVREEGDCEAGLEVGLQWLSSNFLPVLQTLVNSRNVADSDVPGIPATGSCWVAGTKPGEGWRVSNCAPIEDLSGAEAGRLGGYRVTGPARSQARVDHFVGIEGPLGQAGGVGTFAILEHSESDQLWLGAVKMKRLCRPLLLAN